MAEDTKFISVGNPGNKRAIPVGKDGGPTKEQKKFAAERGFSRTGMGENAVKINKRGAIIKGAADRTSAIRRLSVVAPDLHSLFKSLPSDNKKRFLNKHAELLNSLSADEKSKIQKFKSGRTYNMLKSALGGLVWDASMGFGKLPGFAMFQGALGSLSKTQGQSRKTKRLSKKALHDLARSENPNVRSIAKEMKKKRKKEAISNAALETAWLALPVAARYKQLKKVSGMVKAGNRKQALAYLKSMRYGDWKGTSKGIKGFLGTGGKESFKARIASKRLPLSKYLRKHYILSPLVGIALAAGAHGAYKDAKMKRIIRKGTEGEG